MRNNSHRIHEEPGEKIRNRTFACAHSSNILSAIANTKHYSIVNTAARERERVGVFDEGVLKQWLGAGLL